MIESFSISQRCAQGAAGNVGPHARCQHRVWGQQGGMCTRAASVPFFDQSVAQKHVGSVAVSEMFKTDSEPGGTLASSLVFGLKGNSMQKFNFWYFIAALLCLFMMGMQVFVGSPQLNLPIQQSTLPPNIRAVAEVAWHSVTAAYGLMVAALLYLCMKPGNAALAKYIIAQLIALSTLFLIYSITRFGNVTSMYLWPIFLVISVTVGMGVRKARPD